VADPIQALRELRRVAKPGGIVAARETAVGSIYPELPSLEASWNLAATMIRLRGGNPHPGKKIHAWAKEAGFGRSSIACSADVGCYSSPEEREHWGASMDMMLSGMGPKAVEMNVISQEDLRNYAEAWRDWVKNEDGWFSLFHGEILCRKE